MHYARVLRILIFIFYLPFSYQKLSKIMTITGPRHKPGYDGLGPMPAGHKKKVMKGGVYRNTWSKWGIYSSKGKEGTNSYKTSAHQPFHLFFILYPISISFSHPQPNAFIFTPTFHLRKHKT